MTFGFGVNDEYLFNGLASMVFLKKFHLPTLQALQYNALCFYLKLFESMNEHVISAVRYYLLNWKSVAPKVCLIR
jgi:hypothetical protein